MSGDPMVAELLAVIRASLGRPTTRWRGAPEPLAGGFWARMWRVRLEGTGDPELDGRELVARVMPDAAVAARETAVQRGLARAGYPTPRVHLAGPASSPLERAWMVMDHAAGRPLLAGLSGPGALVRLPQLARSVPDRLAAHAAALHRVDPATLGDPWPVDERCGDHVTGLVDRWARGAARNGRDDLVAAARRLRERRPATRARVVCHGDLHPFNVLTAPGGDTVLDWSAAVLADPEYDVAFTRFLLSHPPLVAPARVRPVIGAAGRALARRFVARYEAESAIRVDTDLLAWYSALHGLRVLCEVAGWDTSGSRDEPWGSDHPFHLLAGPPPSSSALSSVRPSHRDGSSRARHRRVTARHGASGGGSVLGPT